MLRLVTVDLLANFKTQIIMILTFMKHELKNYIYSPKHNVTYMNAGLILASIVLPLVDRIPFLSSIN